MTLNLQFDSAKAEAFAGAFLNALNGASLCLMASIGHRTGLLDMMRELPPATVAEIAVKSALNERYVCEWLGAMVTGGVVEVDKTSTHFQLPAEHAAYLTRAAGADNIGVFAQYIAVMGSVEDKIVDCFNQGGGVSYTDFPRFHAVMAEDSGQSVLSSRESHILPLVPGLTQQLEDGVTFLGVGCGSGCRGDKNLTELEIPTAEAGAWRVEEEFVNAIRGTEEITHTSFEDGVRYM